MGIMITRIALTLGLLAGFGTAAAAQDAPPRLKELVTVTAEVVRLGDLVENAGTAANVAVFRAPDLGHTGTVDAARIADAVRPHGFDGLDTGGIGEVVVTRLSRAITPKDIEERITRALAGHQGLGDIRNLSLVFDRELRTLHVEASATADLVVARINVEPRTGRFDVVFELPGSTAARRLGLRFAGQVTETIEAVTLTRPLARGDVVRESDVTVERRPKIEAGGEAVNAEQVIGQSVKRALRAGQVLRTSDLMKTEVVARNEVVTIVFQAPGILLTMRGKALEPGAVGEHINVLNVQSNRTVQATVHGPGQVVVNAATPRLAAAAVLPETRRRAQ